MTKRKSDKGEGEVVATDSPDFSLPEGFNPVGFSGPRVWWKPEVGAVIRGVIVGLETRPRGGGEFLVIRCTAVAMGVRNVAEEGQDAEYETVEVKIGELICVDLRADFAVFRDYALSGDVWEIIACAKEKKRLENGKTFWRFDKGSRLIRKAPKAKETEADDIPF